MVVYVVGTVFGTIFMSALFTEALMRMRCIV